MKEFLQKPITLFVGVAVLLNLGSLGLVFADKIEFGTFLASIGTISMAVFGIYQYVIKNSVITQANMISQNARVIAQELNRVSVENSELKSKVTLLNDVMKSNEVTDTVDVKNQEVIEPEVVQEQKPKRKYTRRKNKK